MIEMRDIEIQVDLEERMLKVGKVERDLSNYDIKHLRQIAGKEFGDREAERAVGKLVEKQIEPFIEAADRENSQENIEKEIEEAFSTHLYNFADPD